MTEEVKNIEFMAAYMEGDIIYGAGIGINLLFRYNIRTRELNRLGVFDRFKDPYAFRMGKMFKYGDCLYCFSRCSYEVAAYHLKMGKFIYYSPDEEIDRSIDVRCVCRVGNDVWIFREAIASSVVIFSMESGKYFKHELDTSVLQGYDFSFLVSAETSMYFDKHIWRCLVGNGVLLAYDVNNLKLDVIKLDVTVSSYTVSYSNAKVFILGRDGKRIVEWEPKTNRKIEWKTGYVGIEDRPFREIICKENQLFLIPCFEDKIYCYEIQKNKLCFKGHIAYPQEFSRLHNAGIQSLFLEYTFRNEDELYLFPFGGNGMICLNTDSLNTEFYPVQISGEDYIISSMTSKIPLSDSQLRVESLVDYVETKITRRAEEKVKENLTGSVCWKRLNGVRV